tara:strand:+ start:535 stop:702 length:168 start_codon:yes stop_codon:yes gene_type:complete
LSKVFLVKKIIQIAADEIRIVTSKEIKGSYKKRIKMIPKKIKVSVIRIIKFSIPE